MTEPTSVPEPIVISELVGVYDADGGVAGEAKYVVGHLLGRLECALCDITHGPVWRKKSFDSFRQRLGVPFEVVHRNERSPEVEAATRDALPSVVAKTESGWVIVLGRDELSTFGGEVDELERGLHDALGARGLALPTS